MPDETILAFDFGMKRIGVAVGERRLGEARALGTISAEGNDARFATIEKYLKEWRPSRLVVGRPLNDDGSAHEMTARCERFANQLRGRFQLPVEFADERFSSLAAEDHLRAQGSGGGGWRERKQQLDAQSAVVILNQWLAQSDSTPAPLSGTT